MLDDNTDREPNGDPAIDGENGSETGIAVATVESDDGSAECTLYPADATGMELMTT
ncbi:DUF7511 domain-containing protein [Halegenticoccus soli]|uniref:DUF7511 domain-containing protein n=1 Tax=Halegenticoccus soli TaxID=1985678 RepID=UPI001304707F|nr:hypothetical protein [Halegenticoccus soli]